MPRRKTENRFPLLTLAADLIPEYEDERGNICKWEVVEDVSPSDFKVADLKFLPFLKKGKSSVTGKTMRRRAVAMKGNLGLADAKRFLAESKKIPRNLRGLYIVFPGTVLRGPRGRLSVACLYWYDDCWSLYWLWLDLDWRDDDRFACSKSR